ncbi:MAG: winged helix-turn-helix domain-containing protein, partial [Pirellulales bacterium]
TPLDAGWPAWLSVSCRDATIASMFDGAATPNTNDGRQTMPAKKTTTTKTVKAAAKKTAKPTAKPKADAPPKEPKVKKAKADGKLSALDAAAKVLADSGEPMTTRQMIEAMATKGLWTSPGGATPERTLYSAILRELNLKGADARFVKTERGKFTTKK